MAYTLLATPYSLLAADDSVKIASGRSSRSRNRCSASGSGAAAQDTASLDSLYLCDDGPPTLPTSSTKDRQPLLGVTTVGAGGASSTQAQTSGT